MLRRLVILLAALAGLAALADRGLAVLAGQAVARAVQRAEGLAEPPDVAFRGFPFVTQAVRGSFREIDITARDVRRERVVVSRLDVTLRDVRVSLGDALSGEVEAVPVGAGAATVTLEYADLNQFLATRPGDPRLAPAGGGRVEVRVTVGPAQVVGVGSLALADGKLVLRTTDVRLADGTALPRDVRAEAARRTAIEVPLRTLPFGVRVVRVTAGPDGVRVTATAEGFVVRAR